MRQDAIPLGAPPVSDDEDLLAHYYRVVRAILMTTMKVTPESADFDDLVQEGVLAAWRATKDVERLDPLVYGKVAARRRMQGHLAGRVPMTGSEREGGRIFDLHRQADRRDVPKDIADVAPAAPDRFGEVEARLDLCEALRGLTEFEQTFVVLVSLGLTWPEIAETLEMTSNAAQKRWRNSIRPRLRERIET